jgi:hypothetical protein
MGTTLIVMALWLVMGGLVGSFIIWMEKPDQYDLFLLRLFSPLIWPAFLLGYVLPVYIIRAFSCLNTRPGNNKTQHVVVNNGPYRSSKFTTTTTGEE